MILKILAPESGEWFFLDCVKELHASYVKRGEEVNACPHFTEDDSKETIGIYGANVPKPENVRLLICTMDDETKRVITAEIGRTYLMNENGKNVDRV